MNPETQNTEPSSVPSTSITLWAGPSSACCTPSASASTTGYLMLAAAPCAQDGFSSCASTPATIRGWNRTPGSSMTPSPIRPGSRSSISRSQCSRTTTGATFRISGCSTSSLPGPSPRTQGQALWPPCSPPSDRCSFLTGLAAVTFIHAEPEDGNVATRLAGRHEVAGLAVPGLFQLPDRGRRITPPGRRFDRFHPAVVSPAPDVVVGGQIARSDARREFREQLTGPTLAEGFESSWRRVPGANSRRPERRFRLAYGRSRILR